MTTSNIQEVTVVDRMQTLTAENIDGIHNATLDVLNQTGVAFHDPDACVLFKKNGFRVNDKVVRFTGKQVQEALSTAPESFRIAARNPDKSVTVGNDDWVFAPTYGPPFLVNADGTRQPGTMADYEAFCKLVQTSTYINVNGYKHVEPQDIPSSTAYLDMVLANMVLCDKPFIGSSDSRQAARDCIEMAGMVFGGRDALVKTPVMISLVNSLSPLQFASEMAGTILEMAHYRQPILIANMVMGGTSGPVTLPELLVLMNAEILAGVVLAQLAGPGTPVIYGTTSCATNMKTGAAAVGTPETAIISSMAIQLARFYHLPSRTGGSLTDASQPDAQALAEGALLLSTAVRSGANFILHACGMLDCYMGNSFEKWLIDEELCGMIRRMTTPIDINPTRINIGIIDRVGIGGNYLTEPETLEHCRTAFFPYALYDKEDSSSQPSQDNATVIQKASKQLDQRLGNYEKPDMGPDLEADLARFVAKRKENQ